MFVINDIEENGGIIKLDGDKKDLYEIYIRTDFIGDYFITKIIEDKTPEELEKSKEQSISEYLKDELSNLSYEELFDWIPEFDLKPNTEYKVWFYISRNTDYYGEVETIPTIKYIEEIIPIR